MAVKAAPARAFLKSKSTLSPTYIRCASRSLEELTEVDEHLLAVTPFLAER
jgi:hypothetical protein